MSEDNETDQKATKLVIDIVGSIKTVTSLNQQQHFYNDFEETLQKQLARKNRQAHLKGLILGYVRSSTLFAYSAAFFYGSYLISIDLLHYPEFFKICECVIYGCMCIADGAVFAADYEKAKQAAANLFKLIESKRWLSNMTTGAEPASCSGEIKFHDLAFSYPSRLASKVLNGLSLDVSKGTTVAFVGGSGCGKSTSFQLLLKFYRPTLGSISIDGKDITSLNTGWLRSKIGLVSQEPLLFGSSIGENIAYGDNSREVSFSEIVAAAQKANIHHFITSLPAGYETPVGEKGAQLSGGQKQRIAIARALVRNPPILLLDEATAALDTESEKIVQEALDLARQGRTCLVIAHRLSTIRNADAIVVVEKGKVAEKGTHEELFQKRGMYYQLHNTQI